MSSAYDLVVVGGGPGGSTLATLVAKEGGRVLIVERDRLPRYQIGESLLPSTVHGICDLLGVRDEVMNAGFMRKRGACMRWGASKEPWLFDFGSSPALRAVGADYAFQVERSKFDDILLRNATRKGAELWEEHTVAGVIEEGDRVAGVKVMRPDGSAVEVRARFVADASGNTSKLASLVGKREHSKFFRNVALFSYWENGGRLPEPSSGNILCAAFADGWFWYIPLTPTLTSVGAVIANEHADRLKGDQDAVFRSFVERCPLIADLLRPAKRVTEGVYGQYRVRKDWSYTTSRFFRPGLFLVGDAACFIDPVLSTGVHLATYSGLLGARSVNTVLRGSSGVAEDAAFREMEARYRAEYNNFYDFLVAFYDMHHDESSYFWRARKVLATEERDNEAFVRLVGGGANLAEFFGARADVGRVLEEHTKGQVLDTAGFARDVKDRMGVPGSSVADIIASQGGGGRPARPQTGLVASSDGLYWQPA